MENAALIDIVKRAGAIMLEGENAKIFEKDSSVNLVTECDLAVQKYVEEAVLSLHPGANFIGEESKTADYGKKGISFVLDPIDGTTNFIKGLKCSAVSLAMCRDMEPVFGAVYNPFTGELFHAEKGGGAFLGGEPIHVSDRDLAHGVACFGTAPYRRERAGVTFDFAREVFLRCLDIRRSGSAALDICHVACGRYEAFFEFILCPWDYAAGMLILEEAGGVFTTMRGEKAALGAPVPVAAGNPAAHAELLEMLCERSW